LAISRPIGQAGLNLLPPAPDGFGIQSRDACELADSRTIRRLGQCPDIPASLWFRQATEQQVDPLMMELDCEIVAG
jgi:hypothetical protein